MFKWLLNKHFNLPVPFNLHVDNPAMAHYPVWEIIYLVNSVPHYMCYKAEFLHTVCHYLQFDLKIHPKDLISVSLKKQDH